MSLSIGRVGVDFDQSNVAEVNQSGNSVTISGRVAWPGGFEAFSLREQLVNLKDNPHEFFYPVIFDEHPYINGFYTVDDVSVEMGTGALQLGFFPFSLSITRLGTFAAPLFESRMLGSLRPNFNSITTCAPYTAVPDRATGWAGPSSTLVPTSRDTSDGQVRTYTENVGASPAMLNAFVSYLVPPQNYYDGSSRVRIGLVDDADYTVFEYTGSVQTYTVPAGVTQLIVDVRGAQGGGELGGKGGRTRCTIAVTAGQVLNIYVGSRGSLPTSTSTSTPGGGGYNGGGDGNQGLVAGAVAGYGTGGDGWGGGGASDIRVGGTALANRVVVAGGGGGMGGRLRIFTQGVSAGGGGGVNGGPGTNSDQSGGRRGTRTAGGFAGNTIPQPIAGYNAGTAGTSGQGGRGANAAATNQFGAGGGGGGLFGGGGGSVSRNAISAGSGGGGSGLDTGVDVATYSNYQTGDGLISIAPVVAAPNIDRYTVVGEQCPNSPFGWELNNGIISVVPVYSGSQVAFDISCWNGTSWSTTPQRWKVTDNGTTSTAATATLSSFTILKNSPEEVIIRLTAEYIGRKETLSITMSLRRGSPMVEIMYQCNTPAKWGLGYNGLSNLTTLTGAGGIQTAADADGNKFIGVSSYVVNVQTSLGVGWYTGTNATNFIVAVGFYPAGWVTTAQNVIYQWYAVLTESIQAVLR